MQRSQPLRAGLALACAALSLPALASNQTAADLSLEELLKTEVVTVSRKSQTLQATAAAAFVISREDIERSGVTSLPEALRMAPGVEVARLANSRWAVTARGFNGRFANKLLVLMDGRSIYSPLFSGVLWEFEDTLLEDVERIEVIRGPGAALWGANAVNGVINIITRKARDTQGNLVVAGISEEQGFTAFRHGGEFADGHYRVWGKAANGDGSEKADGSAGNDYWHARRAGFRGDWALGAGQRFTLSGGAFAGPTGDRWNVADVASPTGSTPVDVRESGQGLHLLGRHDWAHADGSESALQAYVEYGEIDVENFVRQRRTTLDLDFQRRLRLGEQHDLVWGLGYRWSPDRIASQGILAVTPTQRAFSLASAFVQDEFALVPERVQLIVGARLEHNNYTGFEPQPNARLLWTPTPTTSVWGAVSRAVRTPSRAERDSQIDLMVTPASPQTGPLPVLTRNVPLASRDVSAEKVNTTELGFRQQVDANLSVDVATFYSAYRSLRSAAVASQQLVAGPPPYVLQTISPNYALAARTWGAELALDWHALPWWRLQPTVSLLHLQGSTASADPIDQAYAAQLGASSPQLQGSLRSSMTLDRRHQFDLWLRHVGALGVTAAQGGAIPAYTTLDLRYAWRVTPALELSLVGQNLLERRHAEFVPDLLPSEALQVQRSVYVKARLQF